MKKIILVNGLISGSIVSTFMLVSMGLFACGSGADMTTSMVIGFASMFAAFIFVFIGTKQYRDRVNGGVLSFGAAFKVGILIALIGSTMYVISWLIDFAFFMPDFMNGYTDSMIKNLEKSGLSGPELQKQIDEMKSSTELYNNNIFYRTYATYMEILPVGVLSTLISSLILKKKNKIAAA